MGFVIRKRVTIREDGKLEMEAAEFVAGQDAEVVVSVEEHAKPRRKIADYAGKGAGIWKTAEEADAFIRAERDRW